MPLLETDALTIRSTFDSLPDEAKPLASDWLRRYKDQQDDFGLPLFPSEVETQQADESAFVSMFDNVKNVDPTNGIYDVAERFKPGEGDRLRMREAGERFLAKHYGDEEKVRRDFPLYRDDYAMQNGGKRDMGDGEFYSFVSQQVKRQQGQKLVRSRSLDAGFRAAIEGMGSLEKLAAVKSQAAANTDNEVDAGAFLEAYGETQKVMLKHAAFIRETVQAVSAEMDGGDVDLEPLKERLLDMPGTERRIVLAALRMEADKAGEKVKGSKGGKFDLLAGKFLQQTGEAAGRLARSAAIDQPRIERLIASISDAGEVIAPGAIKTAKDAQAYVRDALMRSDVAEVSAMAAGPGGVGALPVDDNRTTITLDETAQRLIQDAKEREIKRLRVANEIRSIGEAADPIPNVFASTIGTSGAALALMAGTRGLAAPALANAYTNIEFNDLSLKYPQMSTADKTQIAAISGAAQAALDYVGVKALDKLPGIKSLIAQPLTKQLAGRALARGALSFGQENLVEAGQDIATPALMQALKSDVPGFDWEAEQREFWKGRADVAIGLLPLTLLGIGAASVNEYRGAKKLLSWNDQLGAAGVVETDRVAVIEAAQSGDVGKAQSLLMEAWGRRNPEVAAEYQDAMRQRQTDMSRATAELERLGAIPTLRRDGDGWTVTSNGTSTKFATWEEARDVATAAMGDMERAQTELVASLSDSFMASTPAFLKGESVEFNTDAKGESLVDRVNAGAMTPEQAMEAAVAGGVIKGVTMQEARAIAAEVFGGQNASERAMQFRQDVEKIAVLGRNTVQNGQSRSIVNAAGNERSFLTVVEEVVEGRWKGGLERRAFTKEQGVRWVQIAEAATGEKFLEGSTWGEIAASAELAPRALTEAISRIVVADVLGRMKDGKRIGPGTVSSGLNLNDREQSALAAILDAFRKLFRALLETASKLAKARQEGKLGGEYDALFDALTGGSSQLEHDAVAEEIGTEIVQKGVDTSGYSPENPGPNGETFSTFAENGKPVSEAPLASAPVRSVTPAQDAEYMAAVEAGNLAKAQDMVDEAAMAAGLVEYFRAGDADEVGVKAWASFTPEIETAEAYTENDGYGGDTIRRIFVKPENVLEVDVRDRSGMSDLADAIEWGDQDWMSDGWRYPWEESKKVKLAIEDAGFDAVAYIDDFPEGASTIVFTGNLEDAQIKSADPVTRDESGNVIPLSQRFNPADDRITYSLRPGDFAARMEAKFSLFQAKPELRLAIAQVAKERVLKQAVKINEAIAKQDAATRALQEAETAFAEEMASLRADYEADEKAIRDERDTELKGVAADKGTELDRERIRRDADKKLARVRLEYERNQKEIEAKKAANDAKLNKSETAADREALKAIVRALDGALAVVPPIVRASVGGYFPAAKITTSAGMLKWAETRIDKLNVELEKWLKKQAVAEISKLFKKARPDMEAGKKGKGKDADMHALFAAAEAAADMDALAVAGRLADLDARIASGELTSEQEALAMTERGIVELVGDLKNADSGRAFSALDTLRDIYGGAWLKWKIAEIERKERRAGLRQDFIEATGKAGVRTERTKADKVNESLFGKGKAWLLNLSSMREVLAYAFGLDNERVTSLVDAERTASNTYEDANQRLGDEIEGLFTAMAGTRTKGERLRWNLSQRTIKTGKGELSQLEAIQALLMWRQEDGRRHMEGTRDESGKVTSSWSYDQAWIDEIEAALTPEARQVMSFIMGKYAAEWATLNPLYRARYGVNMPHHDAYAPITVTPVQTQAGVVVDPVTGSTVSSGSILTPGSLRTRSRNAIAEPDFRDALQTMILHSRQMEYWKAYYDLAVEMNAVLGNREVMNSVHAQGGKEAANALRQWIDVIGQGGFRDASLRLALFQAGSKLQGRAAGVALLGRMSAILSQSTQLAAAAVKMPVTSYLVRLAKLMTGGLGWTDALRSDFIQRRIKTAPPIVRQAMDSLASAKPNEIQQLSRFFGNVLSGADAFFTSGTYAILLDYHREQGQAAGLTGAELDAYAHTEAERATEQVAQPTRTANRSLAELSNTGPLGKIGWAFASEARQKVALAAHAALNAKNDPVTAAKSAFLTFAIGGLFTQVLKNLLREAKGDDDGEMWSLGRLGYAMTIAPLASAIPFGSAIAGDSNMLSNIQRAIQTLGNGEVDFRDVDAMLSAAGLFNDTAASLAQLSHLGLDLGKILSNAAD